MSFMPKHGGKPSKQKVGASIQGIPTSALTVIPIPKSKSTDVFSAHNIDDLIRQIPEKHRRFKVKLRRANGATVREEIRIDQFEDLELNAITEQSQTLKEQESQMCFLHDFLEEWQLSAGFREEMEELLANEQRRQRLIRALTQIRDDFQKAQSPVLDFLGL